jgi:hypothetical protein
MARYKINTGVAAVVVITSLGLVAASQARQPIEPGGGGQKAAKLAPQKSTRYNSGFPLWAGVHVYNAAEARTE